MQTIPRIPDPINNSISAMDSWFFKMHASGLLFHPEDCASDIIEIATGKPMLTSEECDSLEKSLMPCLKNMVIKFAKLLTSM